MRTKKHVRELDAPELERRLIRLKKSNEKVDVLLELGNHYFRSNVSNASELFERAYLMSVELHYSYGTMISANKLAIYYVNIQRDIPNAVMYNRISEDLARTLDNRAVLSIILRTKAGICEMEENYTEAEATYREALFIHEELLDEESKAFTQTAIGELYWKTNRYEESRQAFNEALVHFRMTNNISMVAGILHNIAVLYSDEGNYAQAIVINDESISLKQSINDMYGLAMSYQTAATQYVHIKDYEKAIENYSHSLELKRQLNIAHIYFTLGNIGYVYSMAEQYDLAYEYYQKAFTQALAGGNHSDAHDYQIYSASVLSKMGEYEKAGALYDIIDQDVATWDNPTVTINFLQNKAGLYLKLGRYEDAYNLLLRAYSLAIDIRPPLFRIQTSFALAEISKYLGNYDKAMQYAQICMDEMQAIGDTIRMTDVLELQEECYFQQGDIHKAYELAKEVRERKVKELKIAAQHKVSTLLVQFDVERTRKESELQKLKTQQLEKELEMKQNELTSLALHLVNKNEFLVDLREQITENIDDTNQVIKSIAKRINANEHDEGDWLRFEQQFTNLNPDFSKKLMEYSDNTLTPTELKVCVLIKTGLSSQEIANILFLSKRTIENHRYSIHKKLNLGEKKLNTFLMTT